MKSGQTLGYRFITQIAGTLVSACCLHSALAGPAAAGAADPESAQLDISSVWKESEFNIVGDAGGSLADFNSGASVTVKVALTDGSASAPTCVAGAGSTGETNNLNLGSCAAAAGSSPFIEFTESD